MKKAILVTLAILAAQVPLAAHADEPATISGELLTYTVLLAGGPESNAIQISLSADGRSYVIDSIYPLEVGGTVCEQPPSKPNELVCQAPQVAAFEFNADAGDDQAVVSSAISIPVVMRGGPGRDTLVGGSGPDKLSGGNGTDKLIGRDGDDFLAGGNGRDALLGGRGDDVLRGGTGADVLSGGWGEDRLDQ